MEAEPGREIEGERPSSREKPVATARAPAMAGAGEGTASPSARLKFLCSFGGRILPRPSDGQLKYVGGETRVVAVPRSVTFTELKEKIASVFKADAVIKYQLASEDLDALVSVSCDEDLRHMLEESDRHEAKCSCSHPRLRVFLFPPTFDGAANTHLHHHLASTALEQRYIDAVNGVSRTPTGIPRVRTATGDRPVFTVSSAESSPTSASEAMGRDGAGPFAWGGEMGAWRHSGGWGGVRTLQEIHRVRSSPNLHHGHWQQQGSRLHCFHGCGTVEYETGGAAPGNALRLHPLPHHHHGTRYYSPAQAMRQESGACACCGRVDECCSQRGGDNVVSGTSARQQMWECRAPAGVCVHGRIHM